MKKLFLSLVVSLFAFSFAETITNIEYNGLRKTNENYALTFVEKFRGMDSSEINEKDVEAALQVTGLFEKITVEVSGESIFIDVIEKHYIMPVPFVMYSSEGVQGGMFFMNMNAFGRQDMIVSGVHGSMNGFNVLGIFTKRQRGYTPGFTLSLSGISGTDYYTDSCTETIVEYDRITFATGISVDYNFLKYLNFSLGVKHRFLTAYEDPSADQVYYVERSGGLFDFQSVNPEVSFVVASHPKWNGYFSYSSRAGVSVTQYNIFNKDGYESAVTEQFFINGKIPLFTDRLLGSVNFTGAKVINPNLNLLFNKGKLGVSVIPSKYHTDEAFAGSASLEFSLRKYSFGQVSAYAVYEGVYLNDLCEDNARYHHGPGGGLRLYLSKLAIPAMALGGVYNLTDNLFQFAFSIGVSM